MAENMENKEVTNVTETGLASAPVQIEPEEKTVDKAGVVGKVCAVTAVVAGLVSVAIKGYRKGKKKSAKTSKKDEDVVDVEPTNEDEVSE